MSWKVYWHWHGLHFHSGSEADAWEKYHSVGNVSKVIIFNGQIKASNCDNDYLAMCKGDAIRDGALPIPNGTWVVWHQPGGRHWQQFSDSTEAAVKYGEITNDLSKALIIDGQIIEKNLENDWWLAALGCMYN